MKRITEYLSEEKLMELIDECERDPVHVSSDVTDRLIQSITVRQTPRGKDSYAVYCLKVWLSVAAAVAILLFAPLMGSPPTREEVLAGGDVPSREEVLSNEGFNWYYEMVSGFREKIMMIIDKTEVLK